MSIGPAIIIILFLTSFVLYLTLRADGQHEKQSKLKKERIRNRVEPTVNWKGEPEKNEKIK